ncbi:MAG: hypothetical protein RL341_1090 [Pseudomonadota bacterium]
MNFIAIGKVMHLHCAKTNDHPRTKQTMRMTPFFLPPALRTPLLACTGAALLAACAPERGATPAQLDQLTRQCAAQMVANTCRAMGPGVTASAKPGEVVFVAGIGPVDAVLLANLQNAGERMCGDVRTLCEKDWAGKECGALKALYAPEFAAKK